MVCDWVRPEMLDSRVDPAGRFHSLLHKMATRVQVEEKAWD
jgi:hypothetical protein